MSSSEQDDNAHKGAEDDLLNGQEGKGFGEDEGERDDALEDEQ